jgi:hypothetical protein
MSKERRFAVVDVVRFLLRLPPDLHTELKDMAERDRRSLHAEILVILEEAAAARREQLEQASKLAA